MKLTQVKLDTLTPHPDNYNFHPEAQLVELQKSLDAFQQFKNIVVCQGRIVAGHGLVEAAKRQGLTHLDALVRDDLTPEQERALLVADNALPFLSEPDPIALEALLANAPADIPGVTNEWLSSLSLDSTPPDIKFKEYDESIADDIELCHCTTCGHEHARKK